jgi:hypothetical protein
MPRAPSANCRSIHCSIKQDGRRIIDATWSAVANVDAHYADPSNTCTVLIQSGNVPLEASQEVLTAASRDGSCRNDTTPSTLKVVMQETPRNVTLPALPSLWVPFIPWRKILQVLQVLQVQEKKFCNWTAVRDSVQFNQILVSLNVVSNVSASHVYAQNI